VEWYIHPQLEGNSCSVAAAEVVHDGWRWPSPGLLRSLLARSLGSPEWPSTLPCIGGIGDHYTRKSGELKGSDW